MKNISGREMLSGLGEGRQREPKDARQRGLKLLVFLFAVGAATCAHAGGWTPGH